MQTSGLSHRDGKDRLELNPPDGKTPEGWLVEYDNQPMWLPQWPISDQMALVCVYQQNGVCTGVVVISPSQMDRMAHPDKGPSRLFFKVPKQILLEEGVCPGLTLDAFRP